MSALSLELYELMESKVILTEFIRDRASDDNHNDFDSADPSSMQYASLSHVRIMLINSLTFSWYKLIVIQ